MKTLAHERLDVYQVAIDSVRAPVLAVLVLFPLLFSCAAVPSSRTGAGGGRDVDRDAILQVLREQVAAWNRGDLEGFMEGYLDSPEITFYSGTQKRSGHEELFLRYRTRYQSEGKDMGRTTFKNLEIDFLGPAAAMVRGEFHLESSTEEFGGLFTLIFKKSVEGWRIVHDHTSS